MTDKLDKVQDAMELHEASYERGERAAWKRILSEALRHLEPGTRGEDAEERLGRLVEEREEVVRELRDIAEHLDVEWEDDLDLSDMVRIIGKHARE